ncbi:helix-turn-helix domain-containing protein [Oerskovia enterophila]|nr:helix-turn-helix domain-containing protein [Oerskovia enterophila]
MTMQDGFHNERLSVLPRSVVKDALGRRLLRRLVVTHAGYYPRAETHLMERPGGAPETILLVCTDGTGFVEMLGQQHRLGAGHAVVIPSGVPHVYGAAADRPWSIWWCHLQGSDVGELLSVGELDALRPLVVLRNVERVVALLDEILSTLERDHAPVRLLATTAAAWRLLAQLAVDRLEPAPGDPLERAMEYVKDRVDGPLRVPELAAMVGVSPSRLGALFRRATGGGVIAYQTSLRMARARHLLDTTAAPVKAVADEIGYDDPYYFSRLFRRIHDVSPSEYRRRVKG